MNINELLTHFKGVSSINGNYRALCPAHEDKNPSLSITRDGDKILINCFAGCDAAEILASVGLELKDLYDNSEKLGYGRCTYNYSPTLRKVRTNTPDGKKFMWEHRCGSDDNSWKPGANKQEYPLYNQEALVDAKATDLVYFVEGEKDVETLLKHGKIAVCSPHGATKGTLQGKWSPAYPELFKDLNVVILQDNDDVGTEFARLVASEINGISASIKVIDLTKQWSDLKQHGDITDVFVMVDDSHVVLESLDILVMASPKFTPSADYIFHDKPIPLEAVDIPEFPVDCLPVAVADFVKSVSEYTQTSLEMSSILALGVLATAMQGKVTVHVSEDYSEQVSLFTVAVAKTGERKSSVIRQLTEPIIKYEDKCQSERASEIEKNKSEKRIIAERLKYFENRVIKEPNDVVSRQKLDKAIEESSTFKEKFFIRIMVDDVTPEKMVDMLNQQNGRLTMCSAEGNLLSLLSAKNDRGTNIIEPLLKGYSGDRVAVERISREGCIIEKPHISTILTIQPIVLENILENQMFESRGLTARFLFVKCKTNIGSRSAVTPVIPTDVKERYHEQIIKLLSVSDTSELTLSAEAKAEYISFFDVVEKRLDNEWDYMRAFGAKFVGTTLRIAGLIHGAENCGENLISSNVFGRAIEIAECLGKHAESIYSEGLPNQVLDDAKYIMKRLKDVWESSISKGELKRRCQRFKSVNDMSASLQLLVKHNYVEIKKRTTGDKGRPAETVFINPYLE